MRVYKVGLFDVTRQIFLGRESAGGDSHGLLLPTPDEELIAQLSLVPRLTLWEGGSARRNTATLTLSTWGTVRQPI